MSQSPLSSSNDDRAARDADSVFRTNMRRVNRALNDGQSLSGHERNCAFLNTGGGRFANVSALSGFDFDDDTRSLALVDWDHDGDLDVWDANRTAPRVRFLRNELPNDNHSLALRLQGRDGNRDAIGARVEVFTHRDDPPRIQTLRAGEGFLGQSSKWLHFGLGSRTLIERVTVRWPGGQRQEFTGLEVDGRYLLSEGTDRPRKIVSARGDLAIRPGAIPVADSASRSGVLLTNRLPLPRLTYESFSDRRVQEVAEHRGGPLLVNLWASWCRPCLTELKELAERQEDLRSAGLDVLALNIEQQVDNTNSQSSSSSPRQMLRNLGFPFHGANATSLTVQRLQHLHDYPFSLKVPMATPTSFLIDRHGQLAAIYRGPIDVDSLLRDVSRLELQGDALRRAAHPLAGRWHNLGPGRSILAIAVRLTDQGALRDAMDYVAENRPRLARDKEYGKLLVWFGEELMKQGQTTRALQQFEAALRANPNDLTVINNLAWQLATNPDPKVRDGRRAVVWARHAAEKTQHSDPGVLDTLAAALAESGQFAEAIRTVDRAIAIAKKSNHHVLLKELVRHRLCFVEGKAFRDIPAVP